MAVVLLSSPNPEECKAAEGSLNQFQYAPQHLAKLLQIIVDGDIMLWKLLNAASPKDAKVETSDDVDSGLVFMYAPATEEGAKGEPQYAITGYIKVASPSVSNVRIVGELSRDRWFERRKVSVWAFDTETECWSLLEAKSGILFILGIL